MDGTYFRYKRRHAQVRQAQGPKSAEGGIAPDSESCVAAKQPLRFSGKGDYYISGLLGRGRAEVGLFSDSARAGGGQQIPTYH
jgi:hypothetical protein